MGNTARSGTLIVGPLLDFFEALGRVLIVSFESVRWLFRRPVRVVRWIEAMHFVGVESAFIVAITGLFGGMVLALQSTYALRLFAAESLVGGTVALSLMREIAPVFTAVMVTARVGSAMTAEVGNMRVTEQIDAIRAMGVSPIQYLLSPRLLACVLMMPLLEIFFSLVGMIGAYVVSVQLLNCDAGVFFESVRDSLLASDISMGIIKAFVFGFIVAAIAGRRGYDATGGARGVGAATTRAVVETSVAILIANYLITQALVKTVV